MRLQLALGLHGSPIDGFVAAWQVLVEKARDPYRPELHYMRGPGPKWRAKHRASRQGQIVDTPNCHPE